ncbi:dockerin type I domain-containing protein [Ruminococcus flavefaciens]|uniref:Dockerin domain-containing protein n=1 Tax=Ruminococcus flavefaciens TaxID=1265 RepID=A0A1K1PG69_RUMFL|nr:dockerin type I domain-containing protein [Ruminococcus flavefaciens]SFW45678.1 hypothetical protein SAMN02910280_2683 [Ruminococcus flavefaciens]
MRDTKDIAEAVFRIRDEHLARQRRKRIRAEKACAAVSAIAAAVVITAKAADLASDSKPSRQPEMSSVIAVTTEAASETVTDVRSTEADVSTVVTNTTAPVKTTAKPVTSVTKAAFSMISSAAGNKAVNTVTTVSNAAKADTNADTNNTQPPVTTDINEDDCKEVIRMKVMEVKKYLAALSAAAMASSGVSMPANAESLYTPKPIDSLADAVLYIEENTDKMDFDGSGKLDGFDAYALFTYMNEPESLPDGYAERCAAYGDFNKDGAIDTLDTDLLREVCEIRYTQEDYVNYFENREYLIPADAELKKHVCRTISPDAPAEVREKLLNSVYVDESYTYGSDENRNSFIDYFFFNLKNVAYSLDKYNDAYYKRFLENYDAEKYSFDINEDGVVDLKDLYDIYIFDVASADEEGFFSNNYYFGQFNLVEEVMGNTVCIHADYEHPLRSRLSMPEESKQQIWDKCKPLYDYVYSFVDYNKDDMPLCNLNSFDIIARYIISNTDIDIINKRSLYYVQYRGEIMLCDHSVSEAFVSDLDSILRKNFNKADGNYNENPMGNESYKRYLAIADHDYMHDNDIFRAMIAETKDVLKSGLKNDMFDINKDGNINTLDSYVFSLYVNDISAGRTAEESILPADMWNFIDQNVELDNDDIPGTFGDFMIYESVVGMPYELPQYKLDIYYLQLLEKKGLVDLSDIRPYIEQLCKDKEAGDVDFDGKLTAIDASYVLSYYAETSVNAEISNVTVAHMEYMADLNTDGRVNSVDASEILSTYAENAVSK